MSYKKIKLAERECDFCNNLFLPRYRQSQKFCNKVCQEKFWVAKNKKHLKNYKNKWYNDNIELTKRRNRKWALNNPDKVNEFQKESNLKNREINNKRNKLWRLNNPEKKKAQSIAQYRIRLKKSCEICGNKRRLERHHWRYDKPLMVNTLCKPCHSIQHVKSFKGGNYEI